MSVFGSNWDQHDERLAKNWKSAISENDMVIIAGDISWALRESEAHPDFEFLRSLPGEKVILKGNHDYWWGTRNKVQQLAGPKFYVLQNNSLVFSGFTIVGTRGWELPASPRYKKHEDESVYLREIERLRISLEDGKKSGQPLIAVMHYPPLTVSSMSNAFTDLLEEYSVTVCVYGHLHGQAHHTRVEGLVRGTNYKLISGDFLQFNPVEITSLIP